MDIFIKGLHPLTDTDKYRYSNVGAAPKDQACIFPVKVYDSKGVLKKTVSVEELNARKTSNKERFYAAKTRTRS